MKSYTDIEQSKVLAKILPIESADCCYIKYCTSNNTEWRYEGQPPMFLGDIPITEITAEYIPCWSLSALFETMPSEIDDSHFLTLEKERNEYCCCYEDINGNSFKHEFGNNSIDACYEMILKLHEKGLL